MDEIYVEDCFFLTHAIVERNFTRIRKIGSPIDLRRTDINYWHENEENDWCLYIAVQNSEPQRVVLEEFETMYFYRVYFRCPGCEKRVQKLYLPPQSKKLLCRACHHLRYKLSSLNRNTIHGLAQYRALRANTLSLQRMNIQTPIYRGRFSRRFEFFLRKCGRAGLQNVVNDARGLMEAIRISQQSP